MKKSNLIYLIVGILLLFTSVYIFTRPAIFDSWNFSATGQIGDTIGGITGPIINIIGAFLVYISFKEQVIANQIQSRNLEIEKNERLRREIYDRYFLLVSEIKARLHELQFVVKTEAYSPNGKGPSVYHNYVGLNALNEAVLRLEYQKNKYSTYSSEDYNTYGIFLNFQFILSSILETVEQIEIKVNNIEDREFLISNFKTFYKVYLQDFSSRLIAVYTPGQPDVEELNKIKLAIDKKFKLQQP